MFFFYICDVKFDIRITIYYIFTFISSTPFTFYKQIKIDVDVFIEDI